MTTDELYFIFSLREYFGNNQFIDSENCIEFVKFHTIYIDDFTLFDVVGINFSFFNKNISVVGNSEFIKHCVWLHEFIDKFTKKKIDSYIPFKMFYFYTDSMGYLEKPNHDFSDNLFRIRSTSIDIETSKSTLYLQRF